MSKYLSEKSKKKSLTLMVSLALALTIGVVGTVAYLVTNTDPVVNTFTPADYDIEINETLEDGAKKNVTVTNDGEVPMYIRVALVVTWTDAEGNVIVKPEGASMTGIPTGDVGNWKMVGDYWYYNTAVAPNATTDEIIGEAEATGLTEGVKANLEILVQGIQAEPEQAVIDAWGSGVASSVYGITKEG
ncbi:MAG: hypothetical protein IJN84_08090 [Clostridia bacterium]|nr:hypothetical protein [Clostridia bacterium]